MPTMPKVSIVAPIGTSPPVVTEFLQYVEQSLYQRVTDLTVISTKEPLVAQGVELVRAGVADRYPRVHVHVVELPYEDVDSEERTREFIELAARVLRDQREKYRAQAVHLCVAGGRKQVCIILSLLAPFFNASGVYHVVMPDVRDFNVALERIRAEVAELSKAEDKLAYHRQKKDMFEPVLFPEPSAYNVIKIPIVPYPKRILNEMRRVLEQRKVLVRSVDPDILLPLRDLGCIRVSRNFVYITSEGERLLHILRTAMG